MQKAQVLQLIDEKLQQIEEAEKKNLLNGNLNFGVHMNVYKDSPIMPQFLKKRKVLLRLLLLECFLLPLFIKMSPSSTWDQLEANTLKTVVMILGTTVFNGLILFYFFLPSLVAQTNNTQKEVKKMILQDLRQKVEALEVSDLAVHKTA